MNIKKKLCLLAVTTVVFSGAANYHLSVKADGESTAEGESTLIVTPEVNTPAISKGKAEKASYIVWNNAEQNDGFEVWVKAKDSKTYKKVTAGNFTEFSVSNLKPGRVYKIKIRGYKETDGKTVMGQYSNVIENVVTNVELKRANALGASSAVVKWKKGKDISGYYIQYSDNKIFKDAKAVKISKADINNKNIYDLLSNKKYYVRIRTYKENNKKKYYSAWSKCTKFKTKKISSIVNGDFKSTSGFFKDSVFFGDSVLSGLGIYTKSKGRGYLDGAKVDGVISYSLIEALKPNSKFHPLYRGKHLAPENVAKIMEAKKVFLFFGINDVYNTKNPKQAYVNYVKLIDRIKAECPETKIYILSTTYPVKSHEGSSTLAKNLKKLNKYMIKYCEKSDCEYVDIATYISTSDGYLKKQYCSDDFIHQNIPTYAIWDKVLRNYASNKKK
ncbi:MAG: hypothetical protein E7254_04625 [Lachnospiraceae bacterium]|nr:hypothetical protein [Lachnospiraceae bacterium]